MRADAILLLCGVAAALPAVAAAADGDRYDPYATVPEGPYQFDMREVLQARGQFVAAPVEQPDLSRLDAPPLSARTPGPASPAGVPEGWVQLGEVVQRREVAERGMQVDPKPLPAWADLEGNQYPRKGTVFLNFNGGVLRSGDDNSAENKSVLARHNHMFPQFNGSEAAALTLVQEVENDFGPLGIRVKYRERPSKTVPYTMAMIGGSYLDAALDSPAGGVAPGTDCEDRHQRNVVYAFDSSSAVISQEIAHAWGLDHTMGADRIMSYQLGTNKHFGDNCQPLCEEACQGPGSIGCRLIHEIYCGEDSEQQNDIVELRKIFAPEADTEPPTVTITEPVGDPVRLPVGANVEVKAKVRDNYGGVGWKLIVTKDDEVIFDAVDYERRSAWVFSKLPQGRYEVVVEAEDHAEHVVRDELTLLVGVEAGEESGGDDDSAGDETGPADTGAAETDATVTGDLPSADPYDPVASGCDCRSTNQGPGGALALPLLGAWWAYRRRRRT